MPAVPSTPAVSAAPAATAFNPGRRGFMIAGALFAIAAPIAAEAAPKSKLLGEEWTRHGAGGDPDYGPWAEFLKKWLRAGEDGIIRVDYGGARADAGDLRAFLEETQKIDPTTLSREAAFGWWVNLYNAATIDLVLQEYPVRTILKIKGGLFNTGPWDENLLTVNGARLSLNDVEHGILRPIWNDPRVHYAVNCASIGCPNLAPTPWTSDDLGPRLDAAARAYVNHPRGARVEDGQLIVSKIYDWFEEDFGGNSTGVIAHLKLYAEGDLATRLNQVSRVAKSEYDWDLNAT